MYDGGCYNSLTVAGLQIAVDDGNGGLLVQVLHALGYLHGPVDQDVRRDASAGERAVQRAALRVLHHQAQVGLLQTHAFEPDDVGVTQHGKQLGLLLDALRGGGDILVWVLARRLHGHLLLAPRAAVHFAEATDANDLLEHECAELDVQWILRCR